MILVELFYSRRKCASVLEGGGVDSQQGVCTWGIDVMVQKMNFTEIKLARNLSNFGDNQKKSLIHHLSLRENTSESVLQTIL